MIEILKKKMIQKKNMIIPCDLDMNRLFKELKYIVLPYLLDLTREWSLSWPYFQILMNGRPNFEIFEKSRLFDEKLS